MKYSIIKEQSYDKIKKEIKGAKDIGKIPLITISSDELARKLAEKEKEITIALLLKNRKDKLYQRDTGIDLATLKFMSKNNNTLGIIFDELLNLDNKIEKAKILARIKQNIKLAKKNKTIIKFIFLNEKYVKDHKNLNSLALILKADTKTAKIASS